MRAASADPTPASTRVSLGWCPCPGADRRRRGWAGRSQSDVAGTGSIPLTFSPLVISGLRATIGRDHGAIAPRPFALFGVCCSTIRAHPDGPTVGVARRTSFSSPSRRRRSRSLRAPQSCDRARRSAVTLALVLLCTPPRELASPLLGELDPVGPFWIRSRVSTSTCFFTFPAFPMDGAVLRSLLQPSGTGDRHPARARSARCGAVVAGFYG